MESTTSSFAEGTSAIALAGVSSSYTGGGIAKLYPKQRLKGYYGNYTITVKASDRGYPSNSEKSQFSICIQVRKTQSYMCHLMYFENYIDFEICLSNVDLVKNEFSLN